MTAPNVPVSLTIAAEKLNVRPVLSISEVNPATFKAFNVKDILAVDPGVVLLENGELLFHDCSRSGIRRSQAIAKRLNERGLEAKAVPALREVIEYIQIQVDEQITNIKQPSNKKKTQRILAADDDQIDKKAESTLRAVLSAAISKGATDIHFVSDEESGTSQTQFRIHGKLETQDFQLSDDDALRIGAYIANYKSPEDNTGGDIFEKDVPVDSACKIETQSREQNIRYSHLPASAPKGVSVALRLLSASSDGRIPTFRELGFSNYEEALLLRAFRYPEGVVIFTGPTGSGKSTTMSSGVSTLDDSVKKISLEDPVENKLPGVVQVQVNSRNKKTTFLNYSKMIVRHDPDIIIYGEMRDTEVLKQCAAQANTGHLIITTLHANGATLAPARLVELGMTFPEIASEGLIRTICASRLVPKVCHGCAIPIEESITKLWATDDHRRIYAHFKQLSENGQGNINKVVTTDQDKMIDCEVCGGKGTTGRVPLIEIVNLDKKGRQFIREGLITEWVSYLKEKGWQGMTDKAVYKIFHSQTDPLPLDRIVDMPFGLDGEEFDYAKFEEDVNRVEELRIQSAKDAINKIRKEINQTREGESA